MLDETLLFFFFVSIERAILDQLGCALLVLDKEFRKCLKSEIDVFMKAIKFETLAIAQFKKDQIPRC
jgi:hypothetical protein